MPPAGFEPTISAGERPLTQALDRAAIGTDRRIIIKFYTSGTWTKLDSVFSDGFSLWLSLLMHFMSWTLYTKYEIEVHSVDLLIIWKHLGFNFAAGKKREREKKKHETSPFRHSYWVQVTSLSGFQNVRHLHLMTWNEWHSWSYARFRICVKIY
jgi:hypothetical protein